MKRILLASLLGLASGNDTMVPSAAKSIEMVLQMLRNMEKDLGSQIEKGASKLEKVANECSDEQNRLGTALGESKQSLGQQEQRGAQLKVRKQTLYKELADGKKAIAGWSTELSDAVKVHEAAVRKYRAEKGVLEADMAVIDKAIEILKNSGKEAFLQVNENGDTKATALYDSIKAVFEAVKVSNDLPKDDALAQLKQGGMTEIVTELGDMRVGMYNSLSKLNLAEQKRKTEFIALRNELSDKIDEMRTEQENRADEIKNEVDPDITRTSGRIGELKITITTTDGDLQQMLKECKNEKARLAKEIEDNKADKGACAEAIDILAKEVMDNAKSFLQTKDSGLQAVRIVRSLAAETKSSAMAQLATRMVSAMRSGSGGFDKVRNLISNMIDKLEKRIKEEGTKRAKCTMELNQYAKDIARSKREMDKYTSKINSDKTYKDESESSLEAAIETVKVLTEKLENGAAERAEQAAQFEKDKAEYGGAINAVRKARGVLEEQFGGEGASRGASIIQMLDGALADMEKTQEDFVQDEHSRKAEWQEDKLKFTSDKTKAETRIDSLKQNIADAEKRIKDNTKSLEASTTYNAEQKELEKAKKLECNGAPATWEEKEALRAAQLKSLKNAMRVLSE